MIFSNQQAVYLILAYLVGAIPFGVIVSRLVAGKDVRKQGSGNIGATNVARMMGKKWGILILLLDALKGFAMVFTAEKLGYDIPFQNLVAILAVIGHCYPIYLKFKGGKGVATALGVLLALSLVAVGIGLAVFLIVVGTSRIISAASLSAALAMPVAAAVLNIPLNLGTALGLCVLIWWKHKANVTRLIHKQEPKFF